MQTDIMSACWSPPRSKLARSEVVDAADARRKRDGLGDDFGGYCDRVAHVVFRRGVA